MQDGGEQYVEITHGFYATNTKYNKVPIKTVEDYLREHQDCYERTGERNRVYIDIDGKAGENMSEEEFRKKDKAIEHILLSLDLGSPHSLMKASKYNCIKGGNRMNILSYRITLMKKYGTKSSIKWYVGNKVNPKIKTALSGVINYITDEKEKTKEQQDPLSTYVDYDTTVYDKGRKMRMWNSTKDELELLRDKNDNVCVICTIENFDPMGIHTGDSITVAPAMTLSDTCFQNMRDMAILMMRSIGNFAGGCNVQFAVNPEDEAIISVEINPRVSRSSALASKATGYPIAKIASKLAIGYTLDELMNPVTKTTSAYFEPALDYVIVKVPRWNFDKFKGADKTLGLQMKSVGEVMGIGRSFNEALQKALQSLELHALVLQPDGLHLS